MARGGMCATERRRRVIMAKRHWARKAEFDKPTTEEERLHMVALNDKGYSIREIASIMNTSATTVHVWLTSYRKKGIRQHHPFAV